VSEAESPPESESSTSSPAAAAVRVAPSPHLADALSTRRMMVDVVIALVPAMIMAVLVFRWYAVVQVGLCVLACLATETAICRLQRKPSSAGDYSAVVTGLILGLSLPWSAPWYIGVIGSAAAIGLGKAVFGGLGYNLFNPAMVGRAFVMLSFARELGASAYVYAESNLKILTQPTPLTIAKRFAADLAGGKVNVDELRAQLGSAEDFWNLAVGWVNGSLGETSAVALLIGGAYLCFRRVAAWQIPAGILVTALMFVELGHWTNLTLLGPLQHLMAGSLLFGAFFIATDPVTSPLAPAGRFLFGVGIGLLVVVIRLFSGYPEGFMFAVLLMNAMVPLINRWTIPGPLGGAPPVKE